MNEKSDGTWYDAWGSHYNRDIKTTVREKIATLFGEGKLGTTVLDVGCGKHAVTPLVDSLNVIYLDIAHSRDSVSLGGRKINVKADIGDTNLKEYNSKKAFVFVAHSLGLKIKDIKENPERLDTIVMSDILNYIDWRDVITSLSVLLKPNGRFIIYNTPDMGFPESFHPDHPKPTKVVVDFLKQYGFEIEENIGYIAVSSHECGTFSTHTIYKAVPNPQDDESRLVIARKK